MRKIEMQLRGAWNAGETLHVDNSAVTAHEGAPSCLDARSQPKAGAVTLSLFGNVIAHRYQGRVLVTLAGYNTLTTRSRLKNVVGATIGVKNGVPYLAGRPMGNLKGWYDLEGNEMSRGIGKAENEAA